jgi:hypothetical protein
VHKLCRTIVIACVLTGLRIGELLATHATLLGEVGESLRTAQAILGHSDLKTTLNIYTHAIPKSQRRAVDKVAGLLFPGVPQFSAEMENRAVS